MIDQSKKRGLLFFLIAIAIAAGTMALDRYVFTGAPPEAPPKARVSAADIRRGLALPFPVIRDMIDDNSSAMEMIGALNANHIVIDVPLHIRYGMPAYLEYSQQDITRLHDVVYHIHSAGLEAALNPYFTGSLSLLEDASAAQAVYEMYQQWLIDAAASGADAMYILPPELHHNTPASSVFNTIESLYDCYPGNLYLYLGAKPYVTASLYIKHVRGFIARGTEALPVIALGDSLAAIDTETRVLADYHTPAMTMPDIFQPYVQAVSEKHHVSMDSVYDAILPLQSTPWFEGVVIPAPGREVQCGKYEEFVGEWFTFLRNASRKRALSKKPATL